MVHMPNLKLRALKDIEVNSANLMTIFEEMHDNVNFRKSLFRTELQNMVVGE